MDTGSEGHRRDRTAGPEHALGESAYALLGAKWIPAIVRELGGGGRRYRDLDRSLPGLSQKVLTQNLRRLQGDGLVWRRARRDSVPKYFLTSSGRVLLGLIEQVDRAAADRRRLDGL